ncbi:serine/arginine rich splicing factor, putative [Perkinsus marinus ATCC 50983]|uniref:Serine/arginine rich splicing factor, putative n=1 Tax=Perkinsus marinus (strain ATCC 50983 / TXsc) TaxID=423536 RepID=C5KEH1_PERM5|nr:serine/arginine rich splicing factor, putative [Perkinsus marinus ATCC 50983]EER17109.1 serine/arginine rich splicing factor, putative [Perkinsus marinus ATCC 50983]|eukprot:XP_002785313.1 serine/arginine rich splicing factor, putative [Perkinsus marinus ATCC 50983]
MSSASRSRSYSKRSDGSERSRSRTPIKEGEEETPKRDASEEKVLSPKEKSPVRERSESEDRKSDSEASVRSSRRGDSRGRGEKKSCSRSPHSRRRGTSPDRESRSRSEGGRGRSESDSRHRGPSRRERSRSRTPGGRGGAREGSCSLLVRNLPDEVNPMRLRDAFERFGYVRDVYIPLDYYSKRPRGFGFVEFDDPRDADEARDAMDGQRLGSNYVEVEVAKQRRKSPRTMRRLDDEYRGGRSSRGGYGGGYRGGREYYSEGRSRRRSPSYGRRSRSRDRY